MNPTKSFEATGNLADQAAQSADHAIKSTQRVTHEALNGLSHTVSDIQQQAGPMMDRISEQASALAHRGMDASRQLSDKAVHASQSTVNYIKEEPVKAMLIAAATGAALMAMLSIINRSNSR